MDKQWQAKWIMDPDFEGLAPIDVFHKELSDQMVSSHKPNLKNRHMLIRKSFVLEKKAGQAVMDISADDYYKLYINGRFVGQGPAPAYHFAYKYNRYDITDYLVQGDNVIAVHVYYQGLINRVWNSGDYRMGMIAQVYIEDKLYLLTDKTWKYSISKAYPSGGITGYETQYLENFDSRYDNGDWTTVDFDHSPWLSVCEHESLDYTFADQPSPTISVYEVKPVNIEMMDENTYLIDFGQEITGQFLMTAQGRRGQVVEIRCGEELDPLDDRHVRYKMRCNCNYQEFWTLSGAVDSLKLYDYKAFRYVELIVPSGIEFIGDFRATVRHYPFDDKSFTYTSSNQMVDRIIQICKNGVKYGTQEVYVDCPSREKGQYLGDFTVTGHAHIYLTGKTDLYKQTLKDFADSSHICPGIMAVAPGAFMQEIADFSMQFPMQLFQYYRQSGDDRFLQIMYPILIGLEAYFKAYEREDGLLINVDEKWNLVDWPSNLRDDYDCLLTKPIGKECHNVINAHYYGMLSYINKIRDILGIESHNKLDDLKQTFIQTFYDVETKLFLDKEGSKHSAIHSNALPLFYDIFPTDDVRNAVDLIKNRAQHCGVQMSYFLLKGLARVGEYEAIYKLIEKLWSTMVEEGATTCFEAWGKDFKTNTSLCHPWASGPIPILVEEIVGLNPATPGWSVIKFDPHIPEELDNFQLKISVKTGEIIVKKSAGILSIQGPDGVEVRMVNLN